MNIAFLVKKIYDFQYFIPLYNFLSSINSSIDIKLFIDKQITINREFARVRHFYKRKEFYYLEDLQSFSSDIKVLLSIDNDDIVTNDFRYRAYRHIIIQNYQDYSLSMQRLEAMSFYKNSDVFWCLDERYKNIATELGYTKNFFLGVTPNYWYLTDKSTQHKSYFTSDKKRAVCFLSRNKVIELDYVKNLEITPEKETFRTSDPVVFIEHARKFAEFLEKNDFEVIFKQRSLYSTRELFSKSNYIESTNIYPNESLELAFSSDFGYGYMTSACMHYDLFNKNYINFVDNTYPAILKKMFQINTVNNKIHQHNIEDNFDDIIKIVNKNDNNNNDLDSQIKNSQDKLLKLLYE